MNVGSKHPIAWNNPGHAPLSRLYLHCGIEETGRPGILRIVCHQLLHHSSQLGTSSTGKDMQPNEQIAKLNELTESEVSELTSTTIHET